MDERNEKIPARHIRIGGLPGIVQTLNYKYMNEMRHAALTHTIIGAAMEVHNTLGNGFQEVIYQRALAIELRLRNLLFAREQEMEIFYKGEDIGTRRVDFFIEGKIMVELKAIILLEDVHLAQGLNYLEAYNMETGLLINFGAKSLQYKRLLNKKYQPVSGNSKSSVTPEQANKEKTIE